MRTRFFLVAAVAACGLLLGAGRAAAGISSYTLDNTLTLSADRTQATLTGTITCTLDDEVYIFPTIYEVIGRVQHRADGALLVVCTGDPQPFSVTLTSLASQLKLVPGPVTLTGTMYDTTDGAGAIFNGRAILKR
jgi:hypothetical protein